MNENPRNQLKEAFPDAWLPELEPPPHGLARLRLRLHPNEEKPPVPLLWGWVMAVILLIWALGIQWARPNAQLSLSHEDRMVLGLESPLDASPLTPPNGVQVGPHWVMLVSLTAEETGSATP